MCQRQRKYVNVAIRHLKHYSGTKTISYITKYLSYQITISSPKEMFALFCIVSWFLISNINFWSQRPCYKVINLSYDLYCYEHVCAISDFAPQLRRYFFLFETAPQPTHKFIPRICTCMYYHKQMTQMVHKTWTFLIITHNSWYRSRKIKEDSSTEREKFPLQFEPIFITVQCTSRSQDFF